MQFALYSTLLLSFVSSSLAYLVNAPNGNDGVNWRQFGGQRLAWSRMDTDPTTFAVILTNQDRNVLPKDLVIARQVDGTRGSATMFPPRGGFPTGEHFLVNLVKDVNSPDTILAQSNEFSIH